MFYKQFKKLLILLFISQFIFISGCASNKFKEGLNASDKYYVTDRDILEFNNHVRHMLRLKMKYATISAYVSSTIAIASATAATILSAGGAGAITIASLAGTSAFSSDIMGIFSFSETSKAYQDGVELMEKAEAKYLIALANKSENGEISTNKLSIEAANLYSQTVAALALVEKALASRIPSLEEVKRAQGEVIKDTLTINNELSKIYVMPNRLNLIANNPEVNPSELITFKGNVPPSKIFSSDETVVKVSEEKPISAKITGIKDGVVFVKVISNNDTITSVKVNVSSPISIKVTSSSDEIKNDTFKSSDSREYTVSSVHSIIGERSSFQPSGCSKITIGDNTLNNPSVEFSSKVNNKKSIKIKLEKCITKVYTLKLTNNFGTTIELPIDVQ